MITATHSSADRAWFPADGCTGLRLFWAACEPHYRRANADLQRFLLAREHALSACASSEDCGPAASDELLFRTMQAGVESGDFAELEVLFHALGKRWSELGSDLSVWYEVCDQFRQEMLSILFSHYSDAPAELQLAVLALQRYADHVSRIITHEYVCTHERLLAAERRSSEEAEARYRGLAESGIIGIFISDIFGHAKEANDGFLQMLGYTRAELRDLNWRELTPPEWQHLDDEAIAQLKICGRARPWEKEYFRKDGTRVPILVGVAMLNEIDGIAFVLDISERKRLEELHQRSQELELQNLRSAEASRLKNEFLANMSHELRTPLNSIIGFSELLHDGEVAADSPDYRAFLGHVLQSGRQLLQLVNDVLDLARAESGKIELRPEPVRISQLTGEVCAVLRQLATQRQIALDYVIDAAIDQVTVDPLRFKQVLYNYVSNALKFTEPGGKVEICAQAEDASFFRLEVRDTGVGIASHDLVRLFTEFQQLEGGHARRHPGTGLGLALTRRVVEAQGGHVGVTSRIGSGSVFFAVLPRALATAMSGG